MRKEEKIIPKYKKVPVYILRILNAHSSYHYDKSVEFNFTSTDERLKEYNKLVNDIGKDVIYTYGNGAINLKFFYGVRMYDEEKSVIDEGE